jgi:serine/threonine protein kinase/WD40 repeat protein
VEQLRGSDPPEVGPYRLVARIDEGGMGQVYLGLSAGGRQVAVKVVLPEHAADPEFRQRFRREVEAAMLVGGHYTALVLDADPDAEAPWMATQYIEGPSLETTIRQNGPLSPVQLRALGAALAEGLNAIHQCGLVHRDLKPSNVLMAGDGPRIIDFGVAQADGVTRVTQAGTVVGTPAYMSPEQVDDGDVGPPSDVFSLGGILVYAGTGQRPFGASNVGAVINAILTKPPDLHTLSWPLRDVIAACLAKDPVARPTPTSLMTAFGAIPGPLPLPPLGSSSLPGPRPERTGATVTPTPSPQRTPQSPQPRAFLVRGRLERPRPASLQRPGLQVRPTDDSWWRLAADPAGHWVAAADGDGTIAVWDPATALPTRSWPARAPVRALAASRGDWLGTSGEHGNVQVWDVRTGTVCASIALGDDVTALALDWPGGLLAIGGDDQVRVWDVADPREPVPLTKLSCVARPTALAFDDEGGRVAAGCADGQLRVWEFASSGSDGTTDSQQVQSGPVLAVAWDAAESRWLTLGADAIGPLRAAALSASGHGALIDRSPGRIHVFPLDEPGRLKRMSGTTTTLAGAAFAGPGLLVTGGAEGRLHLWDASRYAMRSLPAPGRPITAVSAAPGQACVAVCDDARRVTVFDVQPGALVKRWSRECPRPAVAVAFSPDGSRLVTAGDAVRVWNVFDGSEVSPLPDSVGRARTLAFDRAGEHLAAAGPDGVVRVWRGKRLRHSLTGHKGGVYAVAFGPDGQLVSAGSDHTIRTWDVATGDEIGYAPELGYHARVLAAHPTDGSFAIGCADGAVRLCTPPRWSDAVVLDGHVQRVMSVCFDAAGRRLATAGLDGTARVWDLARRSADQVLAPGADGWAAAVALADGDFRGQGPAGEFIWQALGLSRHPLPPLLQEDVHG